jgi:hypothetical protein
MIIFTKHIYLDLRYKLLDHFVTLLMTLKATFYWQQKRVDSLSLLRSYSNLMR